MNEEINYNKLLIIRIGIWIIASVFLILAILTFKYNFGFVFNPYEAPGVINSINQEGNEIVYKITYFVDYDEYDFEYKTNEKRFEDGERVTVYCDYNFPDFGSLDKNVKTKSFYTKMIIFVLIAIILIFFSISNFIKKFAIDKNNKVKEKKTKRKKNSKK